VADDPKAQFKRALRLWRHGQRASKHRKVEAMKFYEHAAQSGILEAQVKLAVILLDSELPFYDVTKGFHWMTQAARKGHRGAQYFLGVQFATGEMTEADPKRAIYWYRKAAASGSAEAQYNIGMMYWEGAGVRKNAALARKWIMTAAKNREILAVSLLADAFKTGELGFARNSKKAKYWEQQNRRLFGRAPRRPSK
jgi:uncharacterized protein